MLNSSLVFLNEIVGMSALKHILFCKDTEVLTTDLVQNETLKRNEKDYWSSTLVGNEVDERVKKWRGNRIEATVIFQVPREIKS